MKTVLENLAPPAPPKPPAATRYQRNPGSLGRWMDRAGADFTLAGRIEGLATCSDSYLARLARADSAGYKILQRALSDLVERHVGLIDAATELHDRIEAALAGGAPND